MTTRLILKRLLRIILTRSSRMTLLYTSLALRDNCQLCPIISAASSNRDSNSTLPFKNTEAEEAALELLREDGFIVDVENDEDGFLVDIENDSLYDAVGIIIGAADRNSFDDKQRHTHKAVRRLLIERLVT